MNGRVLLAVLALASLAPAVAAEDYRIDEVRAPAAVMAGTDTEAARVGGRFLPGQQLSTGTAGRVRLTAPGGIQITLGGNTQVQALDEGRESARHLVLLSGAMRARAGDRQHPGELHVNVGRLRVRLRGAEAWFEQTPAVETVCLLSGDVDIRSALDLPWSIARPGHCLIVEPDGTWWESDAAAVGVLERKLAMTAFERPVVAAKAHALQGAVEAVEDAAVSAPAGDGQALWTVVVGSFTEERNALAFAANLSRRLGELSVRAVTEGERTVYRVTLGAYADRTRAEKLRDDMRVDFPGAWVAPR